MEREIFKFDLEVNPNTSTAEYTIQDLQDLVGGERKKIGKSFLNIFHISVRSKTGKDLIPIPAKEDLTFAIILSWDKIWKFEKQKLGKEVFSIQDIYNYYKSMDVVPAIIKNSDFSEVHATNEKINKKGKKTKEIKKVIPAKTLPLVLIGSVSKANLKDRLMMISDQPTPPNENKKDLPEDSVVLSKYLGGKVILANIFNTKSMNFQAMYHINRTSKGKLELKKISSDKELKQFEENKDMNSDINLEELKTLLTHDSIFSELTQIKV